MSTHKNIITKLLTPKQRSKTKKWENYSATFNNINRKNIQKLYLKQIKDYTTIAWIYCRRIQGDSKRTREEQTNYQL